MNDRSLIQNTQIVTICDVGIRQDSEGRYCLNDLHKAAGGESRHQPGKWLETQQTKELIAEYAKTGNPVIFTKQGLGTFVAKDLVYDYAMWISPAFKVKVIRTFDAVTSSPTGKSNMPYHLQRYLANRKSVPYGYFSILQELQGMLVAPLEDAGYILPEHLVPDISEGRMFCKHLRDAFGVDTDNLPTYIHVYPDGRRVLAKLYPNEYLPAFRKHFHETWIPAKADGYFTKRDANALPCLSHVGGYLTSSMIQ